MFSALFTFPAFSNHLAGGRHSARRPTVPVVGMSGGGAVPSAAPHQLHCPVPAPPQALPSLHQRPALRAPHLRRQHLRRRHRAAAAAADGPAARLLPLLPPRGAGGRSGGQRVQTASPSRLLTGRQPRLPTAVLGGGQQRGGHSRLHLFLSTGFRPLADDPAARTTPGVANVHWRRFLRSAGLSHLQPDPVFGAGATWGRLLRTWLSRWWPWPDVDLWKMLLSSVKDELLQFNNGVRQKADTRCSCLAAAVMKFLYTSPPRVELLIISVLPCLQLWTLQWNFAERDCRTQERTGLSLVPTWWGTVVCYCVLWRWYCFNKGV